MCTRIVLLLLPLCLLVGCHGQVEGIGLSAGKGEDCLWNDHDIREYDKAGFGVVFRIDCGHVIRPVPKFWLKNQNPWHGDEPWIVLRFPVIAPFVSVSLGEWGAYLGFKTFTVEEERHRSPERYGRWMREGEFPKDGGKKKYLTPSGTLRRTRWR